MVRDRDGHPSRPARPRSACHASPEFRRHSPRPAGFIGTAWPGRRRVPAIANHAAERMALEAAGPRRAYRIRRRARRGSGALRYAMADAVRLRHPRRRTIPPRRGLCGIFHVWPHLGRHAAVRRARWSRRRRRGSRHPSSAHRRLLARLRFQGRDGRAARRCGAIGGRAGGAVRGSARGRLAVHATADRRSLRACGGDRRPHHAVHPRRDREAGMIEFLEAAIRIATPLLLAALGGILSERAGVFAVGLEGMMLMGAFGGAIGAWATDSALVGVAMAILGGAAIGLVVAIVTVAYRADNMVTGLTANILAAGLTSYLMRVLSGSGRPIAIHLTPLPPWPVPGLVDIPVVGRLLFALPLLTYLVILGCLGLALFLARTQAGLTLRA